MPPKKTNSKTDKLVKVTKTKIESKKKACDKGDDDNETKTRKSKKEVVQEPTPIENSDQEESDCDEPQDSDNEIEQEQNNSDSDVDFDEVDSLDAPIPDAPKLKFEHNQQNNSTVKQTVAHRANSRVKVVDEHTKTYQNNSRDNNDNYQRTNERRHNTRYEHRYENNSQDEQRQNGHHDRRNNQRNDTSIFGFNFNNVQNQFGNVPLKDISTDDVLRYLIARTHYEGLTSRALCGVFKNTLSGMKGVTNLPLRTDQRVDFHQGANSYHSQNNDHSKQGDRKNKYKKNFD